MAYCRNGGVIMKRMFKIIVVVFISLTLFGCSNSIEQLKVLSFLSLLRVYRYDWQVQTVLT